MIVTSQGTSNLLALPNGVGRAFAITTVSRDDVASWVVSPSRQKRFQTKTQLSRSYSLYPLVLRYIFFFYSTLLLLGLFRAFIVLRQTIFYPCLHPSSCACSRHCTRLPYDVIKGIHIRGSPRSVLLIFAQYHHNLSAKFQQSVCYNWHNIFNHTLNVEILFIWTWRISLVIWTVNRQNK